MTRAKGTVLVIEDDQAMALALRDGFGSEGDHVLCARDGSEGLRLAESRAADVVILDVMLPKLSGVDVCRRLRRDGNSVPIIVLTARGQEIDRVVGLRASSGRRSRTSPPRRATSSPCTGFGYKFVG